MRVASRRLPQDFVDGQWQGIIAASDGKLHGVAMVWSLQGQDPAKPWANRAQCYFHPRFVVIDPARDFQPTAESAMHPQE